MNKRSKYFPCPSLKIDKSFLEKLGKIIEIKVGKKNDYFKPYEYTIKSKNETLTYSSMAEILKIDIFPKNIVSMTFRTQNLEDGSNYLSLLIELDNNNYKLPPSITIHSGSDEKLLSIEAKLIQLFDEYKSDFYIVQKIIRFNILTSFAALSLVTTSSALLLFEVIIKLKLLDLSTNSSQIIFYAVIVILSFIYQLIYPILFPYFEFNFSKKIWTGLRVRALILLGIGSLIISAAYDLISFLLK